MNRSAASPEREPLVIYTAKRVVTMDESLPEATAVGVIGALPREGKPPDQSISRPWASRNGYGPSNSPITAVCVTRPEPSIQQCSW